MSEHTPGPWRANSSWIESPQMALRVAAVDWPRRGCAPKNVKEAEANARLIAAAPDLLKALEAAKGWFLKVESSDGADYLNGDSKVIPGDGWEDGEAVRKEIEAAIAKAKGGAS